MPSDSSPLEAPSARRVATRNRLLDAAVEVFAEEGLQRASVEAVCSRAGFTRGAFYSNFSSKEELFLALLDREFDRRAREIESKALGLEPFLRANSGRISPPEATRHIVEFFAPSSDAPTWFVLETEFLLLAMRDPSLAPGHEKFLERFYANISGAVEQVIAAGGRRFVIPPERAMPLLNSVYDQALRASALAGAAQHSDLGHTGAAPVIPFDEFGERLAELLFAITEANGE